MRKAIISQYKSTVENIIEIEPEANYSLLPEFFMIDALNASPGDTWDGKKFIKPILPPPEPVRDLAAEIDEIKATLVAKGVI